MGTLIDFLHRAILQGIPLLFGSTGEIITEKSGNLNLGIPGIMYIGGMSGVIGAFFYENSLADKSDANGFLAVIIPLLTCILGSLIAGCIYSFLTVTLRANQNVTGLALTPRYRFGTSSAARLLKLPVPTFRLLLSPLHQTFSELRFPLRINSACSENCF